MSEIIKIQTNNDGKQTVNARDLHEFLENKDNFTSWINDRIKQYGFVKNIDFTSLQETTKKPTGGRPSKEYHITIDMAKELSMVERNEKGRQARKYFIECERRAKDPIVALNDPTALRSMLLTYSEKVIALEKTVQAQTPKVVALDRIATAEGSMCITSAAKHLQVRPIDLFRWLSANKWIYRRQGNKNYLPYQNRIQQGVMECKVTSHINGDGVERVYEQSRITPKGIAKVSAAL
jgi:anti-repressor protein